MALTSLKLDQKQGICNLEQRKVRAGELPNKLREELVQKHCPGDMKPQQSGTSWLLEKLSERSGNFSRRYISSAATWLAYRTQLD